jgi:hypothetical protein
MKFTHNFTFTEVSNLVDEWRNTGLTPHDSAVYALALISVNIPVHIFDDGRFIPVLPNEGYETFHFFNHLARYHLGYHRGVHQ